MAKSTSPTEPFKRALTATVRALGEQQELEVAFAGEGAGAVGGRVVLPHPQRDLAADDVARIRGVADGAAMKLAHHNLAQHLREAPYQPEARAAFEGVEQARVEAIGARALTGMRANLNAAHNWSTERKAIARQQAAGRQWSRESSR